MGAAAGTVDAHSNKTNRPTSPLTDAQLQHPPALVRARGRFRAAPRSFPNSGSTTCCSRPGPTCHRALIAEGHQLTDRTAELALFVTIERHLTSGPRTQRATVTFLTNTPFSRAGTFGPGQDGATMRSSRSAVMTRTSAPVRMSRNGAPSHHRQYHRPQVLAARAARHVVRSAVPEPPGRRAQRRLRMSSAVTGYSLVAAQLGDAQATSVATASGDSGRAKRNP